MVPLGDVIFVRYLLGVVKAEVFSVAVAMKRSELVVAPQEVARIGDLVLGVRGTLDTSTWIMRMCIAVVVAMVAVLTVLT